MSEPLIHVVPTAEEAAQQLLQRARDQQRRAAGLVRFTHWEEWLAELALSVAYVYPPFVRLTGLFMATELPPLHSAVLYAAFWTDAEVVELRQFFGDVGPDDWGKEVRDKLREAKERLEAAVAALGLEVRGGYYPQGREVPL